MRESAGFLRKIKQALMIGEEDDFADSEIQLHIETCSQLLISMGVSSTLAYSDHPLVEGLILIYVKTFFGFKSDGSVKELPSSFYLLIRQLILTQEED